MTGRVLSSYIIGMERNHGTRMSPVPSQKTEGRQKKVEELSVLDKRLNAHFLSGCETITHKLKIMSLPPKKHTNVINV